MAGPRRSDREPDFRQSVRLRCLCEDGEGVIVETIEILCDRDREMMVAFSKRCLKQLDRHLALRLFLTLVQDFLDANVMKELKKNRLVIGHAATAFGQGKDRQEIDVGQLFEVTKEIDHDFIRSLTNPVLSLQIRHGDLAEVRKKRIRASINMVFDLLGNWQDQLPFADNVKRTYEEKVYRGVIGEMLHLYNRETKMLSNSIILHGPAARVKDLFADRLFTVMEKTAEDIVSVYVREIYADGASSIPERR